MFSVASAFWLNAPLIYVIIPWTIAAVACSLWSWRAFGIFFGVTVAALVAMMLVVNQLPDLGGEWPRDEGFYWWASVVYAVSALVVCSVVAGIAERVRERRSKAEEGLE
jgi:hypothetical protein